MPDQTARFYPSKSDVADPDKLHTTVKMLFDHVYSLAQTGGAQPGKGGDNLPGAKMSPPPSGPGGGPAPSQGPASIAAGSPLFMGPRLTPSSSTDHAARGQMSFDDDYIYIAVGLNLWKRVALSTF